MNILHVHGKSYNLPDKLGKVDDILLESARGILTIDEKVDASASESIRLIRDQAVKALQKAEGIYVLGFGFHDANLAILDAANAFQSGDVYCLNYDGNARVDQKLNDLGIPEENFWKNKSIDEAVQEGFLELRI